MFICFFSCNIKLIFVLICQDDDEEDEPDPDAERLWVRTFFCTYSIIYGTREIDEIVLGFCP